MYYMAEWVQYRYVDPLEYNLMYSCRKPSFCLQKMQDIWKNPTIPGPSFQTVSLHEHVRQACCSGRCSIEILLRTCRSVQTGLTVICFLSKTA